MAVFSLQNTVIIAGGRRIEGFGESDALSYKRAKDDWEVTDCCDGGTVHSRILCRRGEVGLTLRHNSTGNKILADLADAAEAFSFSVIFANGRAINSGEARVLKRPELSDGSKAGEGTWTLSCVPLEIAYETGGA